MAEHDCGGLVWGGDDGGRTFLESVRCAGPGPPAVVACVSLSVSLEGQVSSSALPPDEEMRLREGRHLRTHGQVPHDSGVHNLPVEDARLGVPTGRLVPCLCHKQG